MNTRTAILLAAAAAVANGYTISPDQSKQLDIIFADVTAAVEKTSCNYSAAPRTR